jgi:glycosyltransferase involved in cell wall biosynthesis
MTPEPERIRVMYVIWSLQMGGAERVVADLARGLDRRLFAPLVCCLNFKGQLATELEAEGIPVFALDKRPKLDPRLVPRLVRLMRRERVQVVHTHLWTSSFWGRIAGLVARAPALVVTEHNIDLWRRRWHLLADRALADRTCHFIFVSREVERFYRDRLPLREGSFQVVHNGVAPWARRHDSDPQAARQRLGLPPEGPVVGVIGRLEARKGHRYFLEALAQVRERNPRVAGLIVGEGREKDALLAQREALGMTEAVQIVGFWPDLAEALDALDVFVLPSLMEGHPLAILEAMAAARPVVATAVGGNAEAIEDGRSGLLVPPADPAALAEGILALVADPDRAARLGRAGFETFEQHFSLERCVRANEDTYLRCLNIERKTTEACP